MGTNIYVASHIPHTAGNTASFENFLPKLLSRKKITKKITANTRGVPIPPFLIIDPNGAPIINSTRHATDMVNFSCQAILCCLRLLALASYSILLISSVPLITDICDSTRSLAVLKTESPSSVPANAEVSTPTVSGHETACHPVVP